jgi:hypothetical protein
MVGVGLILREGEAAAATVLQYSWCYSGRRSSPLELWRRLGLVGSLTAGICPRPARQKRFPSNLLLD